MFAKLLDRFHFAAKLVRGAYMVLERKRAAELNLPDPIFPTMEHTHANYHKGMEEAIERIAEGKQVEVMFATHNQRSIIRALEKINALGLPPHCGVYFGQLLGMSDHLTFSLGHHGYKVRSTPWLLTNALWFARSMLLWIFFRQP